ncbi:hypothetical protein NKH77_53130 [Streptomyces sp. M19]
MLKPMSELVVCGRPTHRQGVRAPEADDPTTATSPAAASRATSRRILRSPKHSSPLRSPRLAAAGSRLSADGSRIRAR